MFDSLIALYSTDLKRAIGVTIGCLIILGLMIWISVIDIKKKSVTFWKMLIASYSIIAIPLFMSFFCGCPYLKWFLLLSMLIWLLLLFLNVKFNKNHFIGQADIDLLSAIISEGLSVTLWIIYTTDNYVGLQISQFWYLVFLYLLLGFLAFIVLTILISAIKVYIMHTNNKLLLELRHKKLPVIAAFIPVSVMIPLNIMTM